VQIHGKTPDDLQIKAAQLSSLGTGHPMFLNSEDFVQLSKQVQDSIIARTEQGL
jgi:hypothetical protein